jgi:seryl-tRNA synthetase
MMDINFIRKNPEKVKTACKNKGVNINIDSFLELDAKKRKLQQEIDLIRAQRNKITQNDISKGRDLKVRLKELESNFDSVLKDFAGMLSKIPNIPYDDVPVGNDEKGNQVIKKWGNIPKFSFQPRDHVELGEALDILDIQKAAEVTGARFNYLKNGAVLLEMALIRFTFDILTSPKILKKIADSIEKGYSAKPFIPVLPPMMIKPEVFAKMARLNEEDKGERYYLPSDDLYLIGSAEHTLGPIHMNETLNENEFPIRYAGFSTSFRREAGSYGKDTKGIIRVHQFDKVEMESFTLPENSLKEQNFIVAVQEYLVKSLKLPYQVVMICTGDMGKPDARQIDIEVWIPSQNKYRETHTSDLMTDYQARNLNTKAKKSNGETEFVHMNDATAFAIGRIIVAIIENYQQKDGSIKVPGVLQKYAGFKVIKKDTDGN